MEDMSIFHSIIYVVFNRIILLCRYEDLITSSSGLYLCRLIFYGQYVAVTSRRKQDAFY